MLNGEGNENGKKKWVQKKEKPYLAREAHLFVQFFAVVVATWDFLVTRFMEKMTLCTQKILLLVFLLAFFHCRSFSTLMVASISHFLTAGINFSCCSSNEIPLLCFVSLALALCRSFSRWASPACRLLSRFLCLSLSLYSKFVDMTITRDNTDIETISAFHFVVVDSLIVSAL